jgi:AraC family transcriptional regulator, regulatory protein of adaptative response / DNA-3-methyladenine glycosylase II
MNLARGLRVPGSWDGFELAVRAILGQQITVKSATALAGRIVYCFGQSFQRSGGLTHLFPTADVLADAKLTKAGLTARRAETIRALARAVCEGQIAFDRIVDTDAFLARLRQIPGIGSWTAQYIAMRALGEPDAFPSGDLGLLRAIGAEDARGLEERANNWRPWRAYACMYLWSIRGKYEKPRKEAISTPDQLNTGRTLAQSLAILDKVDFRRSW